MQGGRKPVRNEKKKDVEADDLDRQMRQYWIKSGSAKGKEEEQKNLGSQKMNEEMDEYWKKAKKAEEEA